MKRFVATRLLVFGVAALALVSCTGPDGKAFLAYSWASTPQYLYDENPATPTTVYNGDYFETAAGTYYMEYVAWDDSAWWMIYEITINEGSAFLSPGDDVWFEITLYSTGPSLYEWSSPRALTESSEPDVQERRTGTQTRTNDGGTIRIEYGPLDAGATQAARESETIRALGR
jgi:hypothetical protein